MAKYQVEAQWVQIDPDTLPEEAKHNYDRYKEMYREAKAARERFENCMNMNAPAGQRLVFGYNFGKLSAAIVPDDRKPAKAKASTQSLAEFLAAQAQNGHRT